MIQPLNRILLGQSCANNPLALAFISHQQVQGCFNNHKVIGDLWENLKLPELKMMNISSLAKSPRSYGKKENVEDAIEKVRYMAPRARIVDLT